ncbi:hypothetical protein F7725_001028 [Dissostichus mawsoni]|uniref:Uncharacterized protein n=1 Tax=Dissostichus mawsoni TaxID=36200 RepID=A0A7J5ZGM0_DISMA|nr:hypothetical protein F7725_001028 [Dissostichus mawsoni]
MAATSTPPSSPPSTAGATGCFSPKGGAPLGVSEPSVPDSLSTICCVHMRFAGSSLSTAEQQGDWSSQSGNRERSPVGVQAGYSSYRPRAKCLQAKGRQMDSLYLPESSIHSDQFSCLCAEHWETGAGFRAAQVMCDDGAELSGPDSHQIRPDYARLHNEYFTEINHG